MNEDQRKAIIKDTFDTVSTGYDGKALRFFPKTAKHLAACLNLRGDEHVLDVATGTGHAALSIAACLPQGRVTGVDFSSSMLNQARRKAISLNSRNVEFLEGDMQALGFPAGLFDVAVCSFGIFFVDNMETQLSNIVATVKPGGQVAITSFQENYFHPLIDLMADRLTSYGAQIPPQTWKRIATEEGCRRLFEQTGLQNIRVEQKNVGYYLTNANEWWDIIWNGGFRRIVNQLSAENQERFMGEHLQEVSALRTRDGIWLDVGVLFTIGMKSI